MSSEFLDVEHAISERAEGSPHTRVYLDNEIEWRSAEPDCSNRMRSIVLRT